jgi:hypothetical protein
VVRVIRPRGALVGLVLGGCAVGNGTEGGLGSASVGGSASATDGETDDPSSASDPSNSDPSASDPSNSDPSNTDPSATDPSDTDPTDSDPSDTDPTAGGEVCNGLDDDGDGTIDDGIPDIMCGMGACAATVPGCDGGVPSQCFPGTPTAEQCNGIDDDCNGSTDESLTQSCDSACGPGTQTCTAGAWGECDAPPPSAETCNVADDDCNGAVDDGVPGCRVDVHRSWHPVTGEHFYTTDINEAQCCGFQLEFAGFYELYAAQQPNTTAFYRCVSTFHHYTTDPNCEGLQVEGVMGYIGTIELPGSVRLWRSYNAMNGDHFFTNSQDEHNYAVGTLGFVDEGAVGWVW